VTGLATLVEAYVMHEVYPESLVTFAEGLIGRGIVSPSLAELASLTSPTLRDAGPLLEAAARELGVAVPSRDAVALSRARDLAEGVLSGTLPPFDGAERIASLGLQSSLESPLRRFCKILDRWESAFGALMPTVEPGETFGSLHARLDQHAADQLRERVIEEVREEAKRLLEPSAV